MLAQAISWRYRDVPSLARPYLTSIALAASAAALSAVCFTIASADSLTLIFVFAVVVSARWHGLLPAVLMSVLEAYPESSES